MTPPWLIPLDTVDQTAVARVGGKAATLGELRRANFLTPAGLCESPSPQLGVDESKFLL